MRLVVDRPWHRLQVPDQAEFGHEFEAVVGEVDLPPVEALAGAAHVAVVVVVPAFAEGDEGKPEIVATLVGGFEALFAPDVGEAVDEKSAVEEEDGADEKAPDEKLTAVGAEPGGVFFEEPAGGVEGEAQQGGDDEIEAVQEDQLRILGEVFDGAVVGGEILAAGHPADVAPDETVNQRRVRIFRGVRVLVVMPVGGGPPEGTTLDREIPPAGEDELHETRGLEGAMREIPMVETGDGEHAEDIQKCRDGHSGPAPAGPDDPQAADVQENEGQGAAPLEFVRFGAGGIGATGKVIGIEPLADGDANAFHQGGAVEGAVLGHGDGVEVARRVGAGVGQRVYKPHFPICQTAKMRPAGWEGRRIIGRFLLLHRRVVRGFEGLWRTFWGHSPGFPAAPGYLRRWRRAEFFRGP